VGNSAITKIKKFQVFNASNFYNMRGINGKDIPFFATDSRETRTIPFIFV
jgi:hypothetical protein